MAAANEREYLLAPEEQQAAENTPATVTATPALRATTPHPATVISAALLAGALGGLVVGTATGNPELGVQFGLLTAGLLAFLISANIWPLSWAEARIGTEGGWQRDAFHVLARPPISVGGALAVAGSIQTAEGLGDFDKLEGTDAKVFGPVLGIALSARMISEVLVHRLTDSITDETLKAHLRWMVPTLVEVLAVFSGLITGVPIENLGGFMLAIATASAIINTVGNPCTESAARTRALSQVSTSSTNGENNSALATQTPFGSNAGITKPTDEDEKHDPETGKSLG